MKSVCTYTKIFLVAVAFLAAVQIVYAASATSGNVTGGDNNKQISLKNIGKYRPYNNLPSLKFSQFQYKGSSNFLQIKSSGNTIQMQSTIRLQNGNTTYVYPYKYKTKLQQVFKVPAQQPLH